MNLPPWLRAAVITAGQAAAGTLVTVLIGLILDFQNFVEDPTNPVDISAAGVAFLGVVNTFVIAVITAVSRKIRPPAVSYPDAELPAGVNPNPPAGG